MFHADRTKPKAENASAILTEALSELKSGGDRTCVLHVVNKLINKDFGKFDLPVAANALQTDVINPHELTPFVIEDEQLIEKWYRLSEASKSEIKNIARDN